MKKEVVAEQEGLYPTREQKASIRLTINSCVRLHHNDETPIKDALKESDSAQWKAFVRKKISAPENMPCWTLANRPTDRKTLYSKFVLQRKRNERCEVVKYKAILAVCKNEENDFYYETFSPVADNTSTKMVTWMGLQQDREINNFDFDNAFLNGWLDRPVYDELPKYVFGDCEQICSVMRLNQASYGLRDTARTWNWLLFNEFKNRRLQELRSTPCVFRKEHLLVICHVDELVIFGRTTADIKTLHDQMGRVFMIKYLWKPAQFLRVGLT